MQTNHLNRAAIIGALLISSLVLVACGGGGDGSVGGAATSQNANSAEAGNLDGSPANSSASPVASNSAFVSCAQIKSAQEALDAINAARAVARNCASTFYPAAPALKWNDQLANAALAHSKDMATRNFFSHTNPNGESPFDRTEKAGYGRFTGENIAAGYGTLKEVMEGWLASPGHCANIMRQNYQDVGLACVVPASGSAAAYNIYWTQSFGAK
jgi:uncharacterized protein YkwD